MMLVMEVMEVMWVGNRMMGKEASDAMRTECASHSSKGTVSDKIK